MAELDEQLSAALYAGDQHEQMRLYRLLASGQVDEGCFLLTNAWVLALAMGDLAENDLHAQLAGFGRVPSANNSR